MNTNRRKKTAARDKEDTDSRKDTKEGKKGNYTSEDEEGESKTKEGK